MKILYLPIETTARELDAKLLLASEAANRGYKVYIGRKSIIKKIAEDIGTGVYFNKSHELISFPFEGKVNRDKYIFAALDEEGLYGISEERFIARMMPNQMRQLDLVFLWGNHQKNIIVEQIEIVENTLKVVGNPRFDLLKEKYDRIRKKKADKYKKKYGNYILFNTNFAIANFSKLLGMDIIDHLHLMYNQMQGRDMTDDEICEIRNKIKEEDEIIKEYISAISRLAEVSENVNIVIRPHPSENIQMWRIVFEKYKNVFVIFEGNVHNWIAGARLVVHAGCTTGLEAVLLRRPVILFNQFEVQNILGEVGYRVYSEEDFVDIATNYLIGENSLPMRISSNINTYIDNLGDIYSKDAIMDEIDIIYKQKNIDIPMSFKYKLKKVIFIKYEIKRLLYKIIKNKTVEKIFYKSKLYRKIISSNQKYEPVYESYIKVMVEGLSDARPNNSNKIEIRYVGADTYLLHK